MNENDPNEDTTEINPECYDAGEGAPAGTTGDSPRAPQDNAVIAERRGSVFGAIRAIIFDSK
jgi:hypothetical protein